MRGPLLVVGAEELDKLLSDEEFVCGGGWADRLKRTLFVIGESETQDALKNVKSMPFRHSRKKILSQTVLLGMMECTEGKQDDTVTLLDAVRCVGKAWTRDTERNMRNCFRPAGTL